MSKIAVLTLARRRSRFLSHFLFNYCTMTKDFENTKLFVMANAEDDYNKDIFTFFKLHPEYGVKFLFENSGLGVYGRHLYFNELASATDSDWLLHTCDDQMFIYENWDGFIRDYIISKNIDAAKVNVIIPKFSNMGAVDHMVSRGYINALGRLGGYGNIDSWINRLLAKLPQNRVFYPSRSIMYDFTPDAEIYTPEYLAVDDTKGQLLPMWGSEEVEKDLILEGNKLLEAIKNGL